MNGPVDGCQPDHGPGSTADAMIPCVSSTTPSDTSPDASAFPCARRTTRPMSSRRRRPPNAPAPTHRRTRSPRSSPGADVTPSHFGNVVDTLREKRAFLRDLHTTHASAGMTAGQARLLDTVVTHSALLPDISAMRDVYHPNVALYDTQWDRHWSGDDHGGVHLGVFTSTILPRRRLSTTAPVPNRILPGRPAFATLHVRSHPRTHGLCTR